MRTVCLISLIYELGSKIVMEEDENRANIDGERFSSTETADFPAMTMRSPRVLAL